MSKVGVLDKVMSILNAFPDGHVRLDPRQVANRLGFSAPTTYRLMQAMSEHRLLQQDGRGYRLGPHLAHLGARVVDDHAIRGVAPKHMEWVRSMTDESVELHVLQGHDSVPIDMVVGHRAVRSMAHLNVAMPMHVGASGRALTMDLPEDSAIALARLSQAEYPKEAFEEASWREKWRQAVDDGWASSEGERGSDMGSVAAPVRNGDGKVVAALVVAGPAERMTNPERRAAIVQAAVEAAARITKDLSGQR